MEKLICEDCSYENEPERVYCHNCGVKLNRAILAESQARAAEKKKRLGPPKKRNLNPFLWSKFFSNLVKVAFSSAIVAMIIQAARPPIFVPSADSDESLSAPMILVEMEDSANNPSATTHIYTEKQVNGYLKGVIRGPRNPSGFFQENFQFGRVYADLLKDEVNVGISQGVFGYELYAGTLFRLSIVDGEVRHEVQGGNIGRLRIPKILMEGLYHAYANVWGALEKEKTALSKASRIVFEEDRVGIFFHTTPTP